MKLNHSKGFLFPVVLGLVATGALVGPGATPSQATTVVSSDPFAGPYEIQARARRGGSGFEAVLFTPGNPSPYPFRGWDEREIALSLPSP